MREQDKRKVLKSSSMNFSYSKRSVVCLTYILSLIFLTNAASADVFVPKLLKAYSPTQDETYLDNLIIDKEAIAYYVPLIKFVGTSAAYEVVKSHITKDNIQKVAKLFGITFEYSLAPNLRSSSVKNPISKLHYVRDIREMNLNKVYTKSLNDRF